MQIYIAEGTEQTGPFDLDTIRAGVRTGRYAPTQLAWYEGAPGWEPISQLPGMEAVFAPPPLPPAPPAPPPYPSAAAVPYSPAPPAYPTGSVPAGGYAAPPPPSFVPVTSAPYVPGPGSGPPRKGILATAGTILLALLAVLFGLAKITRPFWSHYSHGYSDTSASTPAPATTTSNGLAPTPVPGKDTKHFVSRRPGYTGNLAEHYMGFSFDYPETWEISQEGPEDFYVQVEQHIRRPDGKTVEGESVTFSYAFNKPGYPMDEYLSVSGPQLLDMLSGSLAKQYPQSTKELPKASTFGPYQAEEQCVTAHGGTNQTTYLRLFIVANRGSDSVDGLSVDLYGSDGAGTKSADDLGKSGGLKTIVDSMRFEP